MDTIITDQTLPTLFYTLTLKMPHGEASDWNEELDLSALPYDVGLSFKTFLFIHTDEETHLTFLMFTNVSVINELKFFLKSSLSPVLVEVEVVNDFLLNGESLSLDFWKAFNQGLKDDWPLEDYQKNIFYNFIKEHTTVMDIIDKLSNIGKENLLQVELDILNLNFK